MKKTTKVTTYYKTLNELTDTVYSAYNGGEFTNLYAFADGESLGLYDITNRDSIPSCAVQVGLGSQYDSLYDHLVQAGIEMDGERYWGAEADEADVNEMKTAIYKGLALYLNVDAE